MDTSSRGKYPTAKVDFGGQTFKFAQAKFQLLRAQDLSPRRDRDAREREYALARALVYEFRGRGSGIQILPSPTEQHQSLLPPSIARLSQLQLQFLIDTGVQREHRSSMCPLARCFTPPLNHVARRDQYRS